MPWWASINFHSLAEWLTLIAVWLTFPAAALGVLTLPSLMKNELVKAVANRRKRAFLCEHAPNHGVDGGPTGEQSTGQK